MTDASTPAGPRAKRPLDDIHADALALAGILHVLDHFDPTDIKGRSGVHSLIGTASALAWTLADDLEAVL